MIDQVAINLKGCSPSSRFIHPPMDSKVRLLSGNTPIQPMDSMYLCELRIGQYCNTPKHTYVLLYTCMLSPLYKISAMSFSLLPLIDMTEDRS